MKKKLAATFLAGAITATAASSVLNSRTTPQGTLLRVANAETVFNTRPDGGLEVLVRACGYEERVTDAGLERLAEPCWRGELSAVDAKVFSKSVLDLYKATVR